MVNTRVSDLIKLNQTLSSKTNAVKLKKSCLNSPFLDNIAFAAAAQDGNGCKKAEGKKVQTVTNEIGGRYCPLALD